MDILDNKGTTVKVGSDSTTMTNPIDFRRQTKLPAIAVSNEYTMPFLSATQNYPRA